MPPRAPAGSVLVWFTFVLITVLFFVTLVLHVRFQWDLQQSTPLRVSSYHAPRPAPMPRNYQPQTATGQAVPLASSTNLHPSRRTTAPPSANDGADSLETLQPVEAPSTPPGSVAKSTPSVWSEERREPNTTAAYVERASPPITVGVSPIDRRIAEHLPDSSALPSPRSSLDTSGAALSAEDSRSVFARMHTRQPIVVTSALTFVARGPDVWGKWPDVNRWNVTGPTGTKTLNEAVDILSHSGARSIADDLFHKGVAISFGTSEDFVGTTANAIGLFTFDRSSKPPATPAVAPRIVLNPLFAHEDPRLLAVILAHEGTHLQQFLDGRSLNQSVTHLDREIDAWMNGLTLWQGLRQDFLPIGTPLTFELELGYQFAIQGEGALRDLLVALQRQTDQ